LNPLRIFFLLLSLAFLTACGGGSDGKPQPTQPIVVVAYGDSLTHGGIYVTPGNRWVEKMAAQIQADGIDAKTSVTVVNQSISGETATQALARLPSVLASQRPTHIFLAHGTNDIWWDCPGCYDRTQQNLLQMANLAKAAGAKVIMTDFTFKIRGDAAALAFSNMYTQVAQATNSSYLQIIAGIPLDDANYHPERVHLRDAAQEALKNNAVKALYATLK
jgi:lysophospholipase L1-like esterase